MSGIPLDERKAAIAELGESGDPRAFDLLAPLLGDEYETQHFRDDVVTALGACADPRALPLLLPMLDATSAKVHALALSAIGRIGDRRTIRLLLEFGQLHPQHRYIGSDAIVKMGEPAVLELLDILNDSDPGLVLAAVVLLGRLANPRATPALIQVIETRSTLFRCHGAESLGMIGDRRAINTLLELLQDKDPVVRTNAAAALAKIPDPKSVKPLIECLSDTDEDVLLHAIEALREINDNRAAEPVRRFLAHPSVPLRVAAAEALGRMGDAEAVGPLLELVRSDDESVKLKAIGALRRIRSPRSVSALLPLLFHANDVVRQRVIDTLGQIGDAAVARQIEYYLKADRSEIVRAAAAKALGDLADGESVDPLVDALNDVFAVKCRAIVSLGMLKQNAALAALISMLRDPMSEARFHACGAVAELAPPKAVNLIEPLLDDPNQMVRRGAAKALQKLGDPRGEQMLNDPTGRKARKSLKHSGTHLAGLLSQFVPDTIAGIPWIKVVGVLGGLVAVVGLLIGITIFVRSRNTSTYVAHGNVNTLSYSPDGKKLAVGRTMGLVEVVDAESGKALDSRFVGGEVTLCWGAGGSELDLAAGNGLSFWNLDSEKKPPEAVAGHASRVMQILPTPSFQSIATVDDAGVIVLWDAASHQPSAAMNLAKGQFTARSVSPDGKTIASGDAKGNVILWNPTTAEQIAHFAIGGNKPVQVLNWSVDGNLICAGDTKGVLAIYNVPAKAIKKTLETGQTVSAQFLPDSTLLTTGASDLFVWNIEDGTSRRLGGFTGESITSYSVAPDGKRVAVASNTRPVTWILDVTSGDLVRKFGAR